METKFLADKRVMAVVAIWILVIITSVANAQLIKLHDFTGEPDGYYPEGGLYYDGTFLYGTTYCGGINKTGIIFKIKPDGTDYSKLYDFSSLDSSLDGSHPRFGSLISDGTFLYGMTYNGGTAIYDGVIFKLKKDGTEYTKLHDFVDSVGHRDGVLPFGSLFYDGNFLYGMTRAGGEYEMGVIFRIKPDGTEYTKLYEFGEIAGDGEDAMGSLVSDGTYLYGMTTRGGLIGHPWGYGILFRVKPDGSGFTDLLNFDGLKGQYPTGSLFYDGTFLYGMAAGGANGAGVIFKINPDGTEYIKLWDFINITGSIPVGTLICNGTFLYGMTSGGGANKNGAIFKIKPDGTEYTKLWDFPDTLNGRRPQNSLVSDGTFLYGMTCYGGIADSGTVFKFQPLGMGVPEKKMETCFSVYPNPCTTIINVECTNTDGGEVVLFDISGKQVSTMKRSQDRKAVIDVSDLNRGMYFLQLRTNKEVYYEKIIKK